MMTAQELFRQVLKRESWSHGFSQSGKTMLAAAGLSIYHVKAKGMGFEVGCPEREDALEAAAWLSAVFPEARADVREGPQTDPGPMHFVRVELIT